MKGDCPKLSFTAERFEKYTCIITTLRYNFIQCDAIAWKQLEKLTFSGGLNL